MSDPLCIQPLSAAPRGQWSVPGSKSLTNRALILAALADGHSLLEGALRSDDTEHMLRCLAQLGIEVRTIGTDCLAVHGGPRRLQASTEPLFIGNSGTCVRFLTALAALVPGETQLHGDEHMARRPIRDLVDGLTQLGVDITIPGDCPPLSIHGGQLPGGHLCMRGDRSSQYFSALLMAAGCATGPVRIDIDGTLVSRPYVAMTKRLITRFGGTVHEDAQGYTVHPCRAYRPLTLRIEPDASAASYPFALAAAGQGSIRVPHLGSDSLQGDCAFVDVLAAMGADIERTPHYLAVSGPERLHGIDIDMCPISDCVMSLAAIAPLCEGPTTIRNVANIRLKETDRLAACVNELRRIGQQVTHGDDWLRIEPRPITPAVIDCYADHRMAMSFSILGLLHPGITIADPACVSKTYPHFFADAAAFAQACGSTAPW